MDTDACELSRIRGSEVLCVLSQRLAIEVAGVAIVHGTAPELWAKSNTLPNLVFCGNEICKAFADLSEPSVGCDVVDSELQKDMGQDLFRNRGDWAWRSRREIGLCWSGRNRKRCKGGDKIIQRRRSRCFSTIWRRMSGIRNVG